MKKKEYWFISFRIIERMDFFRNPIPSKYFHEVIDIHPSEFMLRGYGETGKAIFDINVICNATKENYVYWAINNP